MSVLIQGETGVGKELFARAIHGTPSPSRPFIAFNCGAVAKDLLGAELFGNVRGAFTGATSEGQAGRFELANGGTLCLDEIGEMPLELQPLLLRALEEGVIYRLGDGQPRRVDVRLMSLTNHNLLEDVGGWPVSARFVSSHQCNIDPPATVAPACRRHRNSDQSFQCRAVGAA